MSSSSISATKITWSHPTARENGVYLELDEIGGYEIRYRNTADGDYTYVTLTGNETTEYIPPIIEGAEFEIAVFDTQGIYSQFVKVQ